MSKTLIRDVTKLTDGDKTKIRKRYGFKTTKQLIKSVEDLFDLGISDKRKEKLAFRYYADEFNKDILEERDKKKIEVRKKKTNERKMKNRMVLFKSPLQKMRGMKINEKKGGEIDFHIFNIETKLGNFVSKKNPIEEALVLYLEVVLKNLNESPIDAVLLFDGRWFISENDAIARFVNKYPNHFIFTNVIADNVYKSAKEKHGPGGKLVNVAKELIPYLDLDISPFLEITNIKKPKDPKKIKIKHAGVLNLDSHNILPNEEWDTKTNRCVPDWIMYKYKNVKGFKKMVKDYDTIQELATRDLDDEYFDDEDDDDVKKKITNTENNEMLNPNKFGYTIEHIENICYHMGVSLYVLIDGNVMFYQDKISKDTTHKRYPLIFEMKNNHLYPIVNTNAIQSIKQQTINIYKNATKGHKIFHGEEKEIKEEGDKSFEFNEKKITPFEYLVEMMREKNLMSYDRKGIKLFNNVLCSFKLNDTYFITEYDEIIHNYFGDKYTGQTATTIVSPYIQKLPCSYMNNEIQDALLIDNVKNRTHIGVCNNDLGSDLVDNELIEKYDFNKFYRYVMCNPIEEYAFTDFNSVVCEKTEYDNEFGLYYIETNDFTLLHGTNWYSNAMTKKAVDEGIDINIKYFINCVKGNNKNMLKELIDELVENINDDKVLKLVINSISGYMGKTKSSTTTIRVDTDENKMWECYFKKRDIENCKAYFKKQDEFYFYGDKVTNTLIDNRLPIYIQILDQSNMLMYDKIKEIGGTLVARKTDAFYIHNPINKPIISDEIGGLKNEPKTSVCQMNINRHTQYVYKPVEKKHIDNIVDSNQANEILQLLEDNKSFMLLGRAGVGKTYILKKIIEKYGDKCSPIAFTNKAKNNLDGMTIHRFLTLNKNNKMCIKNFKAICATKQVIIIDEISMIPSYLWKHIAYIKNHSSIKFVLAGDYRQLPPIEEMGNLKDYFNHNVIQDICDYNYIELTKVKRYDGELLQISEDVYNSVIKHFPKDEFNTNKIVNADMNICWTNKKRKMINSICNKYHANKCVNELIKYTGNDNKYNEDIIIYEGCKLLSNVNDCDLGMVKNEILTILKYDDDMIYFKEIEGSIKKDKIHDYFILGYAITTYKSQGDTCQGNVIIFESDKMFEDVRHIYTAITRAVKYDNLTFM